MKADKITNEFLASSDWDEIVGWEGNYTLGVGYCYMPKLVPTFKQNNINYHFFDVKWGRCGTTYLFSALRPSNIIVLTAWQNSGVSCGNTKVLFRIWKEILFNLSLIDVKMTIFDVPAAWHRSNLIHELGEQEFYNRLKERKELYKEQVIKPCLNEKVNHIDLSEMIDQNSILIDENFNNTEKTNSPWHFSDSTLSAVAQYFIDSVIFKKPNIELQEIIKTLEKTKTKEKATELYEKKNNCINQML